MTFLITIIEIGEGDSIKCEHYRRRVEIGNIHQVISTLDKSLFEIKPPRAKRRDAGVSRKDKPSS